MQECKGDLSHLAARKAALLAIVALFLCVSVLDSNAQKSRKSVGLTTHHMDTQTVTLLKNARVGHIRTTLYWHLWDDASYRNEFAAGIKRMQQANVEVTVIVHSPPSLLDVSYENRAQVYDAFASFVAARAAQFPSVQYWQLWNEQNAGWTEIFGWGRVSMYQQGRHYAEMLSLAYPRIRQANSGAKIVVGGLAGSIGPCDNASEFVRGILDGSGSFDAVAVHAYGAPVVWQARDCGVALRDLMKKGRDRRPIWLTEFGMNDAQMKAAWGVTDPTEIDNVQMDQWKQVAEWNDSNQAYERLLGYVLYDHYDYNFGIVRADKVTPRPTYEWVKKRNGG